MRIVARLEGRSFLDTSSIDSVTVRLVAGAVPLVRATSDDNCLVFSAVSRPSKPRPRPNHQQS